MKRASMSYGTTPGDLLHMQQKPQKGEVKREKKIFLKKSMAKISPNLMKTTTLQKAQQNPSI